MSARVYRMGAVAQLTGLTPELLRAWERRYALLRPKRSAGGVREYDAQEVALLVHVRTLLREGLSIGEVAARGRPALLRELNRAPALALPSPANQVRPFVEAIGRGQLLEAEQVAMQILHGPDLGLALDGFVSPALQELGRACVDGASTLGAARLGTELLRNALLVLFAAANAGLGPVRVVSAPLPDDGHDLGALLVALRLARGGVRTLFVSGPVPVDELREALRLSRASAVCLSAVKTLDLGQAGAAIAALRTALSPRAPIFLGGPGVAAGGLALAGVRVLRGRADLVGTVGKALRPGSRAEAASGSGQNDQSAEAV